MVEHPFDEALDRVPWPTVGGSIRIRGAREHNLRNVDVELPRDKLIVFTGLSGSGKSSLAFDTIYAEGQRRYVESLSAYARQFLGQMDKPDVDFIEGLSPAISIDQKSASRNPRSTVGTITEIYDYLRLLYARIGVPHCPNCGRVITRQTPQQIVDRVLQLPEGTRFQVLAPVVRGRKGEYEGMLKELAQQGYTRARVDGELVDLGSGSRLARYENHTIEVVVDRLVRRTGIERRLTDSLETALRLAEGVAEVEIVAREDDADAAEVETMTFSEHLACTHCGISFDELAPRNFSFNSPYGACERCDGLGTRFEVDPELVVPNDDLSISEGAIAAWAGFRSHYFERVLESVAAEQKFSLDTPWKKLKKSAKNAVLYGTGQLADQGVVPQSVRTAALVHHAVRRRGAVAGAPPPGVGERPRPRADRGLHAGGPVPGVRRRATSPGIARGHDRRHEHLRGRRAVDPEGFGVPRFARPVRARPDDRRARREGSERAAALPARRRARLPHAQPLVGHARRRRGAAHPARVTDRERARRRALRARRAVDRFAPARQPAPHRHARAPARHRQHRHRRRARRGDHPRRRSRRRHRARRR